MGVVTVRRAAPSRNLRQVVAAAVISAALASGITLVVTSLAPGEPEAAPVPTPFHVPPGRPVPPDPYPVDPEKPIGPNRFVVLSAGIDAPLVPGGVAGGQLQLPNDPGRLTLYTGGGQPCGEKGTVLVSGHVSSRGVHGALWDLASLPAYTAARVTCADGTETVWRLTEMLVVPKDQLPGDVFDADGELRLVVVTCGGPVIGTHYRDNVVAIFTLEHGPQLEARQPAPSGIEPTGNESGADTSRPNHEETAR